MAADTIQGFNATYRWLVLSSLIALGACASAPPGPPTPEGPQPLLLPASPTAQTYTIDATASTLHILVYRGGPMAKLGHNHVISSPNVQGSIWRGASLASSGFDITVPVNDLIVDNGSARAAEGDDFATNVNQEAIEGTKANMLRESVLDGARFPVIRIQSVSVQGDANAPTVVAALRIKDQTRHVTLPLALQATDSGMHIKGEFDIRQTDFGITPISVALGALQVQDTLKIKFFLVTSAP
ncbi:MAG: YceI family protein [Rhodoferax sp.]|nr:YceI family protein [Rhodoferax sp.]